ncbi:rhodanese-like domain-containing protein [Flavobacteriaceae bacterium XHP0103]|uniref:rhodanese-like domain-containing protein n=1 Tax=Marixanthotalea marina TaxID=2844359 RepID=UPI002989DBD6|nr:rhodanese-like domain-containing protein [Marixanthotalea marina]MBU3821151.1 rhodanese-like domain-containing protein [Marixanthotalea marina]
MKKLTFLCFLALTTIFGCKEASEPKITTISAEEMQSLLETENVKLIDVRTEKEYNDGSIPNAQNIDFLSPTFQTDIQMLDKNQPVLLYCNTGKRSMRCAEEMVKLGFVKIYDLEGGYSKWKREAE